MAPAFSSRGDWLAYLRDNRPPDGQWELFVRPFPERAGTDEVTLSDGGANDPTWSATRNEIYLTTLVQRSVGSIMAVGYTIDRGAFIPSRPVPLTQASVTSPPFAAVGQMLDLHPDGERFAVATRGDEPAARPDVRSAVVIENFFEQLRRMTKGGP